MNQHPLLNRRDFMSDPAWGLGGIALASLLAQEGKGAPTRPVIDLRDPLAPRAGHFKAKANKALVIFCSGALSQIDTFDYKPELVKRHGQPMPGGDKLVTFQGAQGNLHQPVWKFRPRGQSGKMVSDGERLERLCARARASGTLLIFSWRWRRSRRRRAPRRGRTCAGGRRSRRRRRARR